MKQIPLIIILFLASCKKDKLPAAPGGGNPPLSGTIVAKAGPDQIITFPSNSVFLTSAGSFDPSGKALSFLWRRIPVQGSEQIQEPNNASTVVKFIEPGTYEFELRATNLNGFALDTVRVIILLPSTCQASRPVVQANVIYQTTLPLQNHEPELLAAGNKLIVPQKHDNSSYSNKVNVFDKGTQSWTVTSMSAGREGIGYVTAGNKVFFAGGLEYTGGNSYTTTAVIDVYDAAAGSWSTLNLSEPRAYVKGVTLGNKVYFAGGLKDQNAFSRKVDIYDLSTGTWTSSQMAGDPRAIISATASNNKIFFTGGYTRYDDPTGWGNMLDVPSDMIDVYDAGSGQWSISNMVTGRGYFSAVQNNNKLYIAGGYVFQNTMFEVEILDLSSMNIMQQCLSRKTMYYQDRNAVVHDGKIIFLSTYHTENKNLDIYDPVSDTWSIGQLSGLPAGIYINSILSVNNELWVTLVNNMVAKIQL